MLLLMLLWAGLGIACMASGVLVWRLVVEAGGRRPVVPRLAQLFWLGASLTIAELQLFSLFHAIDVHARALIGITVCGGLALSRPLLRFARRRWRSISPGRTLARVLLISGATGLVARSAVQEISWYDTISTHIQQVKWAQSFGAVVGLANLNPKLAFDQAHHLFAALVDAAALGHRSAHATVGFFLWAALAQWLCVLTASPRDDGETRAKIFAALTLPFLLGKSFTPEVASLSGDLVMGVTLCAGCLELIGAPTGGGMRRRRTELALATTGALGGLVFAFKFSGMVFSAGSVLILLVWLALAWRRRRARRVWLSLALPGALLAATVVRRIVLSGWPLFPVPVAKLPLPWTLPFARTEDQYIWIKSWARLPGANARVVLDGSFWAWFRPWFDDFHRQPAYSLLVWSAIIVLVRMAARRDPAARPSCWATICEVLAWGGLVYWFVGAPDLRFGGIYLWLVFGCAGAGLLHAAYAGSPSTRVALLAATIGLCGWNGGLDYAPQPGLSWTEIPRHPLANTQLQNMAMGTPGPFPAHVTAGGGDTCGDINLPCTPYPGIGRLRQPNAGLRGGFLPLP